MNTLDDEIAGLRALAVPALIERFRAEFGREARSKQRPWLLRRLVFRVQERRLGGLSEVARRRLDELIAEIDLPLDARDRTATGRIVGRAKPGSPSVGTTLTREWRGQAISVQVLDDGFECAGVVHKSLSAAAKAITGTHWNGRLFFGLAGRRKQA